MWTKKSNESFVGATVLNAKKGAYMDKVVTGLDFASLYPSIMRAHNLCYNTIVLDKTYDNLPDIEYETVSWTTTDNNGTESNHRYRYAQNGNFTHHSGKSRQVSKTSEKGHGCCKKEQGRVYGIGVQRKTARVQSIHEQYLRFARRSCSHASPFRHRLRRLDETRSSKTKTLWSKEMVPQERGDMRRFGDEGDTPLLLKTEHGIFFQRIDELFKISKEH